MTEVSSERPEALHDTVALLVQRAADRPEEFVGSASGYGFAIRLKEHCNETEREAIENALNKAALDVAYTALVEGIADQGRPPHSLLPERLIRAESTQSIAAQWSSIDTSSTLTGTPYVHPTASSSAY